MGELQHPAYTIACSHVGEGRNKKNIRPPSGE